MPKSPTTLPPDIVDALAAGEITEREAARRVGVSKTTVHRAKRRTAQADLPEGVEEALSRLGVDRVHATSGWLKDRGASVHFRLPSAPPADLAADIIAALAAVPAARRAPSPKSKSNEKLLTVYPLFDAHVGMHAWSKETGGQDYDLALARQDLEDAFANLAVLAPPSSEALLILGGDSLHADNADGMTPKSKHILDTDGRHSKVAAEAVAAFASVVDHLLAIHQHVTVRVLPGNHDPNSHLIITHALAQRYRIEPRVGIDLDHREIGMMRWGRCAILSHHGDKRKPADLAMLFAAACPFWGETPHRHILTGHIHHDSSKDFPGVRWESVRAFAPADAYGAMFGSRRGLQAMTFCRDRGLVSRVYDHIERRYAA